MLGPRIKSILYDLVDPKDQSITDRSRLEFRAIYILTKTGFSDNEVYSLLTLEGTAMYKYLLVKRRNEENIKEEVANAIQKAKAYLNEKVDKLLEGVEVIGHNARHDIIFRNDGNILSMPFTKLNTDGVHLVTGKRPGDEKELEKAKNRLITLSKKMGLVYEDKVIKEGIWRAGNEFLLISKNNALLLTKEGTFTDYPKPVYKNLIIDQKNCSAWFDKELLLDAYNQSKLSDVFAKMHDVCRLFNWKHAESAEYITALLMLAPFQNGLDWNPFIYLSGASGTGKTTLIQDFFSNLYPGLLNHLGKSTAHAIAQEIGNTGRIPVLDEFEKNRRIPEILELAKTANRGGYKTSGTPGVSSLRYQLKHTFWFVSVFVSLLDEAQRNRAFVFEMKRAKKTGAFKLPAPKELKRLGTESLAVVLKSWDRIEAKSKIIKGRYPELDARMKDTLKSPMAVLELVDEEKTGRVVEKAPPAFAYVQPEREEEKILDDILTSDIFVHTDSVTKITVFDALMNYSLSKTALNDVGLTKTKTNETEYLAVHPPVVTRKLLNDLRQYEYNNIKEPLERFEGAKKSHPTKIGRRTQKCVLIPWKTIESIYDISEDGSAIRKKPLYKKIEKKEP